MTSLGKQRMQEKVKETLYENYQQVNLPREGLEEIEDGEKCKHQNCEMRRKLSCDLVYIYLGISAFVYINICIYQHLCMSVFVYICIYMCVYLHVCISTFVYVYISVCLCLCISTFVYIYFCVYLLLCNLLLCISTFVYIYNLYILVYTLYSFLLQFCYHFVVTFSHRIKLRYYN